MALFFLVSFIVLFMAYLYVGARLIVPSGFSRPVRMFLWTLLILFLILPVAYFTARTHGLTSFGTPAAHWILFLSMGVMSLLFTLIAIRDTAWLAFVLAKKISARLRNPASRAGNGSGAAAGRSLFPVRSTNMAILGIAAILTVYGVSEAHRTPRTARVDIPIANLPEGLRGFRIAQITDLHAGPTLQRGFVQSVVEKVNRLRPDIVVVTGDLADGTVKELHHAVAPLAELSPPDGVFFITGNHEYYSGIESWLGETRRLGFITLLNGHRVIERGDGRLLIAGVTDLTAAHFMKAHASSPEAAVAGAPQCHARILLAHQPASGFHAGGLGIDFLISGHTHGGQFFPWNYIIHLVTPYVAGLYPNGDPPVYVSRGTGYWGVPLRIGAPSEITLFTLTDTPPAPGRN